jgi:hypothetical protein
MLFKEIFLLPPAYWLPRNMKLNAKDVGSILPWKLLIVFKYGKDL